jgi:DNA topoisomerase III
MRVFIAEKPELARAIVDALGGGKKNDGYYECGADVVTWCFGHMLALKDPEDYDPSYGRWSMDQLPMSFIPWEMKITPDKKAQVNVIKELLKKSTSCIHSGDADPEGQLLVDELLTYFNYNKPVQRVLINDNNLIPVQRALANMRPNSEFKGLSEAALARAVGDQLYGYNMTRAYTLAAQSVGLQGVLSVGRVQTPILGLVVRRDLEHESHTKSYYYVVEGTFNFAGINFTAKYRAIDSDQVDEKGRLLDVVRAEQIAEQCGQKSAVSTSVKSTNKRESPPLPYNLLKLQADASRKFGFKPDQVKDISQALREKHKLITYNRSDCQYLNDEHHGAAPAVLNAIGQTAPVLAGATKSANPAIKSRAFNSAKTSAHHGIIPTETVADFGRLSDAEQKIYMLIARAYVAQFFPEHEYVQTDVVVTCEGHSFTCRSNITVKPGWKVLYRNDQGNDEVAGDEDALSLDLRNLQQGQEGDCNQCIMLKNETKPLPRYTIATLLSDLTRVAKYVRDPELKALLIEKDKGKEGEHGGIGTPATRDSIIKNLFDKGFLEEKGKAVISTQLARAYYKVLPDEAKYPDMTAIWHAQQQQIEQGEMECNQFVATLMQYITGQVANIKTNGLPGLQVKAHPCPECGKALRKIRGSRGDFWGCTGYDAGCKASFEDNKGQPVLTKKPAAKPSELHKCMACGSGLIRRPGQKPRTFFWGCSGFPNCKQTYPDVAGKPNYSQPPKVKP